MSKHPRNTKYVSQVLNVRDANFKQAILESIHGSVSENLEFIRAMEKKASSCLGDLFGMK